MNHGQNAHYVWYIFTLGNQFYFISSITKCECMLQLLLSYLDHVSNAVVLAQHDKGGSDKSPCLATHMNTATLL